MTVEFDKKEMDKIHAVGYHMQRYSGKTSADKLLQSIAWTILVVALPVLGILNEEGYRALGIGAGIFFSWIPVFLFIESRQLKKKELTGQPPRMLF